MATTTSDAPAANPTIVKPAKKATKRAPRKTAVKKTAAPKQTAAEKAPGPDVVRPEGELAPPQVKGDHLLLDLNPDMQNQADAHFRELGKSGGYFHGTDSNGRAIYKAID